MQNTERPLRVLLVEDHGAIRRGLELFLTAQGLRVTGGAGGISEAVQAVEEGPVDVAVVDLALCDESGLTCIELLLQRRPELAVLAYSGLQQWPLSELLDLGVRGFTLKAGPPERLVEAIRTVAAGRVYIDPEFDVGGSPAKRPGIALSERERQVLGLLAQGLTGAEVASRLFLSPATVRTHVQNAMRKLGARTRVQAIALAAGDGEPGRRLAPR